MGDLLTEIADQVPALRRYALALTQNHDQADDLVQDCLERAIRKHSLWRPSGKLKSWLFKIMINVNRNNRRKVVPIHNALPLEEVSDIMGEPSTQLDKIALKQTAKALEKLPEDQKVVLMLIVLENVSYQEASEILNIPIGTVMSRLSRARQNLTKLTEDQSQAHSTGHLRTIK